MLGLAVSFGVDADFVLLAEVYLVYWFFRLAEEGVLEAGDLVVLVHCVAWDVVLVQRSAQLVVRVHVHLFLQLLSNHLIFIVLAQLLVELSVLTSRLSFNSTCGLESVLLGLFHLLVAIIQVILVVVELDHEVVLLGSCDRHSNLL